jgi:hypothetical protein
MEETAEGLLNPLDIGAERPDLLPTHDANHVSRLRVDPLPARVADTNFVHVPAFRYADDRSRYGPGDGP